MSIAACQKHGDYLRRRSQPRHTRKNTLHELIVAILLVRRTGIARNHQVAIQVARGECSTGNTDGGRATGNNERLDVARAKGEMEVSLEESTPTVLGNEVVPGYGCQLVNHLHLPSTTCYNGLEFPCVEEPAGADVRQCHVWCGRSWRSRRHSWRRHEPPSCLACAQRSANPKRQRSLVHTAQWWPPGQI